MQITYNQSTDTLRIEFLDHPSVSQEHNDIIIHRNPEGNLAAIEIPAISRTVPLDAFHKIHLNLPTGSEGAMRIYNNAGMD